MVSGRPIFPGTSTMNQIERILELTGSPLPTDLEAVGSPYAATMLSTLPPVQTRSAAEVFPSTTADARDFLRSTLLFNPGLRPSAQEALRHVFVAEFHSEEEEPVYPHGPIRLPLDDNTKLTATQYRDRLYQEITERRREARKAEQSRQQRKLAGTAN